MRRLFILILMALCKIASSQISPTYVRVVCDTLGYDSLRQILYPSGKLFYQVPYKNGKINGWYEQYHENGAISGKELRVNETIVDGYNIYYWDNGTVSEKGYYKGGHQVGKWYEYYPNGALAYLVIYNKEGILIERKQWINEKKKWIKVHIQ